MYCNKCGAELRDGAKFCNQCGAPQTEEKPEPPETGTASPPISAAPIIDENAPTIMNAPAMPAKAKSSKGLIAAVIALAVAVAAFGIGVAYKLGTRDTDDDDPSSRSHSESSSVGDNSSSESGGDGDSSSEAVSETVTSPAKTTAPAETEPPETTTTTTATSGDILTPPDTQPPETTPPDVIKIPENDDDTKEALKNISSMFGMPYDDAEKQLEEMLGVDFVYNYDEEYISFNNEKLTSRMLFTSVQDSEVPFLGTKFFYAVIEFDEIGCVRLIGFHYASPSILGDTAGRSAKFTDCLSNYTKLYNSITAACKAPDDTHPKDDSGAMWYDWVGTVGGNIWLCCGEDLWNTDGYNDLIISFADPITNN